MITTSYDVTGMTCGHCVTAVRAELTQLPGVTDVTIGLVPGGASAVTVTSGRQLAEREIRDALDEAGGYLLAGG